MNLLLLMMMTSVYGFNFVRFQNPVLGPLKDSLYHCPVQDKKVPWEGDHTFNPAAIVKNGNVYLFYRAEDDYGEGVGNHTSRIGLAVSVDGINFVRQKDPVLYPTNDDQKEFEWPGGVEDPRIVEDEDGRYVLTYTQWNQEIAALAVATSNDLVNWKKHGFAFKEMDRFWSKSGSIVCELKDGRMIAKKINGLYWMYFGEGNIHVAWSDDLISWKTDLEEMLLTPRQGKFDSELVEPGPPALIMGDRIFLLYNGKNAEEGGDENVVVGAYSSGVIEMSLEDPKKLLSRSDSYFLTPEKEWEMRGQYFGGTVFIEGLVYFKDKFFLYYGAADSMVGVAISKMKQERDEL